MLPDNELAILSCFFPDVHDRTAKELETNAGLSHEPAFRTLKKLTAEGFLKEKKYKTNVYEYVWREESLLAIVYSNTNRLLDLKAKHPQTLAQAHDVAKQAHARMTLLLPAHEEKETAILCVGATHDIDTVAALVRSKHDKPCMIIGKTKEEFEHLRQEDPELHRRLMECVIIEGIELFLKEVYGHGI